MARIFTVVLGASRGIGFALCKELKNRGHDVLGTIRNAGGDELKSIGVEVVDGIDVTDNSSTSRLREALGKNTIHALVTNVGIMDINRLDDNFDFDSMRRQYEVNCLAHLRFVHALLDYIAPDLSMGKDCGRVCLMSTRAASIADNTSGGNYGYRMSRAALNMAGSSLAVDLRPRNIAVLMLHPGFVKTDMTREVPGVNEHGIDPAHSAKGLASRIDELDMSMSGKFLHQNGTELPW